MDKEGSQPQPTDEESQLTQRRERFEKEYQTRAEERNRYRISGKKIGV